MLPTTAHRIGNLRNRVAAARQQLDIARCAFGENADPYLTEEIRLAYSSLDDVENLYLAMLAEDVSRPRTYAQEAIIVSQANFQLVQIAMPRIEMIAAWASAYGPNFRLMSR